MFEAKRCGFGGFMLWRSVSGTLSSSGHSGIAMLKEKRSSAVEKDYQVLRSVVALWVSDRAMSSDLVYNGSTRLSEEIKGISDFGLKKVKIHFSSNCSNVFLERIVPLD